MVCFVRAFRRCLVGLFGLISFSAFAGPGTTFEFQGQASAACSNMSAAWLSRGDYGSPPPFQTCVYQACSLDAANKRYSLYLGRSGGGGSNVCGYTPDWKNYGAMSSLPYTSLDGISDLIYFNFTDDTPPPTCQQGEEVLGWKTTSPNGTGDICLNGCAYSVALQPPPLPLYSAYGYGRACTASDRTPIPAGDPNEEPCPSSNPECAGTGQPTDPESPPNTGGGGFQCDSPPVCNADGVTCSMLYQQWRGRCEAQLADLKNSEQLDSINQGIGGTNERLDGVNDRLDGVNDRLDAANQKLDAANSSLSSIDSNTDRTANSVNALRDDLATGWSDGGVKEPSAGDWGGIVSNVNLGTDSFDISGFGFPRSCPRWQDVSFTLGMSAIVIPLSTFDLHCTIFEWTGVLIMAFAAYYASRIILTD